MSRGSGSIPQNKKLSITVSPSATKTGLIVLSSYKLSRRRSLKLSLKRSRKHSIKSSMKRSMKTSLKHSLKDSLKDSLEILAKSVMLVPSNRFDGET
jgi:hypothetical protein